MIRIPESPGPVQRPIQRLGVLAPMTPDLVRQEPAIGAVLAATDFFGSYYNANVRRRELMRHSMRDADAAVRFNADVMRWCKLIRNFLLRTLPDPGSFRPRDAFEFAYLMKKFYELSESQLYEFIRFFTMSIA